MPFDPDTELMLKVRRGNRAAFEALVAKYQRPVINTIFRSIGDLAEAEDLTQNVFVQVWRVRGRYKPTAKFSTWLFTIVRNTCLNEVRRRARHPADSLDKPVTDAADGSELPWQIPDQQAKPPNEEALAAELRKRVDAALAALPEAQRTAMLLLRHQNMPYEEIAKVMRCSLSATKSLIHRAREMLRDQLKPYLRP
ncbi:MAG: sigma-70 family RNA polymerase sigma factor [Verrucomicrobia bacterium]|nr:sigma-70 family RNA polymerase sigma factor [Verrucomicrobiota bacterium]